MDTFKLTIRKDRQREDKSYIVFVRYTHDRKTVYLPTSMVAEKKDLTSSFKIKNMLIIERGEDLIRAYREKLKTLMLEINDVPFEKIVDTLKKKDNALGLEFVSYFKQWTEENADKKGLKNYQTAVNALCKFVGRDKIFFGEISVKLMRNWERSMMDKPRACSLYTSSVVKIFNDAREYFNDYENGIIKIKDTLHGYKAKKQNVAEKRALTKQELLSIANLPREQDESRYNLARDCFLMSFCLMGMNAIDLYNATDYDGKRIKYNRTKTKDRRSDKALMVVDVPDFIKPLMKRYAVGAKEGYVFNFSARYATPTDFNRSLSIGLKTVGERANVGGLQFYAARHTMATTAVNDARIPIYIVNDMLSHIDERMRVTNLYIRKDFTLINEANGKLMDYVFGEEKPVW